MSSIAPTATAVSAAHESSGVSIADAAEVLAPLGSSVSVQYDGSSMAVVGKPAAASTVLFTTAMSIAYVSSGVDVPTEQSSVCPPRAGAGRHRKRGHKPFTPVQRKVQA